MSDLASQKGVSRDDLLAAITQGLQTSQTRRPGQATDNSSLAAKIADRRAIAATATITTAAAHVRRRRPPAEGRPTWRRRSAMSSDQLVSALQTGLAGTSGAPPATAPSASLLQGLQFDRLA